MAFKWQRTSVTDDRGNLQNAVEPVIVSASRSTDIPAFYTDWLLQRLRRGYCAWVNPFNGEKQYVSFAGARFFVFWSKNPMPLLQQLDEIDKHGFGYYVQFTLNDYDSEQYEPNVPKVSQRIETFKRLSDRLGPSRVIWRFDPMILTDEIGVNDLARRAERLMAELHKHTEKLVFSFADIGVYQKVGQNLGKTGVSAREFTQEEMEEMGRMLGEMGRGYGLSVATCAETIDLGRYEVGHNSCIDDDLMARCSPGDDVLLDFLGGRLQRQGDLFADAGSRSVHKAAKQLKDLGQRVACGCVMSKDIGSYNTCPHMCVYCYANASRGLVNRRCAAHNPESESI